MNRTFVSFPITDFKECKKQLLNWANQFETCCFLDNHKYRLPHQTQECILAAGVVRQITAEPGDAFQTLQSFVDIEEDWIFGHLSYDLKNELERLESSHEDGVGFPGLFFFVPQTIIILSEDEISVGSLTLEPQTIVNQILSYVSPPSPAPTPIKLQSRFSKREYLNTIQKLQTHIARGDCYEVNFCQEFYTKNADLNPLQLYFALSDISPNPFSAFYKIGDRYLCCASPERYLKKEGNILFSQPIKGTWPRNNESKTIDEQNKKELFNSAKERTENVMIVDLVRNDLSKVCDGGTVVVNELYGIYSFPQVHQMISTVSGKIKKGLHFVDAIKATFPMGSMTGAPKKRVMELIEKYENTKRGLFSGAVGYITPASDFDFNVVIRSVLINRKEKYLSFQVGSAITIASDPEKEYEECLLKAEAILKALC